MISGGGGGSSSPIENVNVVAASGSGTVTIPDVTTDTISDVTLTGNPTFAFPTAAAGKSFTIILRQDGTGNRTVTWPGAGLIVWFAGGGVPVLSTAAGAIDAVTFICTDGTHWEGAFTPGYSALSGGDDAWTAYADAYGLLPTATVGTWGVTTFNSTSFPNSGFMRFNSSSAQNDAIAYKFPMSAGTWSVMLTVRESTNTGIATVEIDGVSVGTLDTYNAVAGTLAQLTLAGITVGTSALHEIRLLMATKNASSSSFQLGLFSIGATRTA